MQTISSKIQNLIQSELRSSERLIWSSSPNPTRMAKKAFPLVLFGLPWTAFAMFWMAGASGFKAPDFSHGFGFFPLFGLPFILVGFGMLSSPYWAAKKAVSTGYVVTNERAIIFQSNLFGSVSIRSFMPNQLSEISSIQKEDGSGDLIIDKKISTDSEGSRTSTDIGFFGIQDVKSVEQMVLSLSQQASK